MKKLICLIMLFTLGCPVLAVEPQWSEFCPPQFLDLDTSQNYVLRIKKYWVSRKVDFENSKKVCLSSQEKDVCLAGLRTQEINKSNAYYAQMQQLNSYMLNGAVISAGALAGNRYNYGNRYGY